MYNPDIGCQSFYTTKMSFAVEQLRIDTLIQRLIDGLEICGPGLDSELKLAFNKLYTAVIELEDEIHDMLYMITSHYNGGGSLTEDECATVTNFKTDLDSRLEKLYSALDELYSGNCTENLARTFTIRHINDLLGILPLNKDYKNISDQLESIKTKFQNGNY
jgi:hypothetical protein